MVSGTSSPAGEECNATVSTGVSTDRATGGGVEVVPFPVDADEGAGEAEMCRGGGRGGGGGAGEGRRGCEGTTDDADLLDAAAFELNGSLLNVDVEEGGLGGRESGCVTREVVAAGALTAGELYSDEMAEGSAAGLR